MRRSTLRRAFLICRTLLERIACLALLLVAAGVVGGSDPPRANAAEPGAIASPDYPLTVVAFASVDRVRARYASLAEAMGSPELADKLLLAQMDGNEEMQKLIELPGLDPTKPIGMMSYPNWFKADGMMEPPDSPDLENILGDPSEFLLESLANLVFENSAVVICLPAKDRHQLLASVRGLFSEDGHEFVSDPDRTGWYKPSDDDEDIRIGFVGGYLLLVIDDSETKHFDRHYPDFEKLAKASLGRNDIVYSLQKRGLPKLLREAGAEALKSTFAATLQQQDDEPDSAYRCRTAFGAMQLELLDVLVSHVDEFRITGHVDATTKAVLVETELVGAKDGKLAKFCNGLAGKGSSFARRSNDDAAISASVAFPLNQKQWKPIAETLRSVAATRSIPEEAEVLKTFAKTIEAGQLDIQVMSPNWRDGLVALRVSGSLQFAEQFNDMLTKYKQIAGDAASDWELSHDAVDGVPIHRLPESVLNDLQFLFAAREAAAPLADSKVVLIPQVVVGEDGKTEIVHFEVNRDDLKSAEPRAIWLAVTPQAIWLGRSSAQEGDCPDWFKSAIEESLTSPNRATPASRGKTPFQLTLRGLGAAPTEVELAQQAEANSKIIQTSATADENDKAERERGEILRDRPNAIRIEALPTATGLKLNVTFEEAYFHWYAAMLKHSLDELASQEQPINAEPPAVGQPQPKRVD